MSGFLFVNFYRHIYYNPLVQYYDLHIMKLRAWMWYLLGFPITYGVAYAIFGNQNDSWSLLGEYTLYGGIALGLHYLSRRLWFGKKERTK